jgi:hypothetical protein
MEKNGGRKNAHRGKRQIKGKQLQLKPIKRGQQVSEQNSIIFPCLKHVHN